jgi:hypothetical protein
MGYLLNIAIPWSEILPGNQAAKTKDKIGINIQITDIDKDEKGSQTLYMMDQNEPLPTLILSHRMNNK